MVLSHKICLLISLFKFIKGNHCFEFLKRRLPHSTIKKLHQLVSLKCKLMVEKVRLEFLNKCINDNHFPWIYNKMLRRNKVRMTSSNLRKLTQIQIDSCIDKINQYKETCTHFIPLIEQLSIICHIKLINFCKGILERTANRTWTKLNRSLSKTRTISEFPENLTERVHNLSNFNLDKVHLEALSMGLNYKVPPKRIDKNLVDANFENLYSQFSNLTPTSAENEAWFKAKLVDISQQFANTPINQKSCLTNEHREALK